MDVINFSQAEIIAPDDLTAISVSARDAFDARDSGALGWPAHWAHVTVSQASADIVNLTSGEYYAGTEVYGAKETQQANLQSFKPVVASDERWVALILRGSEDLVSSMRPFETSEEPLTESIPVNQSTPKATRRNMSVIVQTGSIMVAPAARPAINENDCCVAFVRLRNTGIAEIVPNEAARVKTVYEIEQRLTTVELSIGVVVELTQSLQTDVANLAAKFDEIPDAQLFRQITRDVSIARQLLNFPDEARNYYYDNGLLRNAFWDFTYAGADFRINEGIRFPYQIQQENVLRVLNPAATDISFWENTLLLPAYTERLRIENPQGKLKKDISNTVHTVKTAVQHTVSNTRLRYGETVTGRIAEGQRDFQHQRRDVGVEGPDRQSLEQRPAIGGRPQGVCRPARHQGQLHLDLYLVSRRGIRPLRCGLCPDLRLQPGHGCDVDRALLHARGLRR